jgi:hypothetical protein
MASEKDGGIKSLPVEYLWNGQVLDRGQLEFLYYTAPDTLRKDNQFVVECSELDGKTRILPVGKTEVEFRVAGVAFDKIIPEATRVTVHLLPADE